jgi:hypothetical protein
MFPFSKTDWQTIEIPITELTRFQRTKLNLPTHDGSNLEEITFDRQ